MVTKLKCSKLILMVLCIKLKLKIFKKTYFSNYLKDSNYYDNSNNLAFVCNRLSRINSQNVYRYNRIQSRMRKKEINTNFIDYEIKYDNNKSILFNRSYMRQEIKKILIKDYNARTHEINKTYLYCYDDKNYILRDGYSRSPQFHESSR